MAKPNPARLGVVHPSSESRIERKAAELVALRAKISELEKDKTALSAQLLKMVLAEGEADDDGKIRYETDAHKFQVVKGCSASRIDKVQLTKLGVKQSIIAKATIPGTEFEYVRVAAIVEDEDES